MIKVCVSKKQGIKLSIPAKSQNKIEYEPPFYINVHTTITNIKDTINDQLMKPFIKSYTGVHIKYSNRTYKNVFNKP
jgi:hypothetical protein